MLVAVEKLKAFLLARDYKDFELQALSGDASTRQYFRVHLPKTSLIAAVYPESFDHTLPFCTTTKLYLSAGLPVPQILALDGQQGIVLQEDLGDIRLQDWLEGRSQHEIFQAYKQAIDLITIIQSITDRAADTLRGLAFDYEKLHWELDFFYKHYCESLRKCPLSDNARRALYEEFHQIASALAARPKVLCHRDYHSRNLMMHKARLHIIDHQDSRLGPKTYDLVSLLCDPYVALDKAQLCMLRNQYNDDFDEEEFELMTVQRLVKAIGTYSYQAGIRQNTVYLKYIPRAASRVLSAANKLERFPSLCALLFDEVEDEADIYT
ncbi:MAG: phosphotransferase [Acidobacteriota bacterium]|nr:phosphotransferase [Blastocatellia bacterium]MDW8411359.1 phosphotransferase [Acidobacteriota bacterium]